MRTSTRGQTWMWSLTVLISGAASAACGDAAPQQTFDEEAELELAGQPCDYPQAFGTPDHSGRACPELHGMTVVHTFTQDPDAGAENEQGGFLQIHESPPVTFRDWVVIPTKSGFVDVSDRTPERYHVTARRWAPGVSAVNAHLPDAPTWTFDTDWQPIDAVIGSLGFVTNGYVQLYAVAIANGSVYAPAAHGELVRLSLTTGAVQARFHPFSNTPLDGDARLTVTNAPSVAADGTVYYAAVAWPTDAQPFGKTPRGSYLIRVRPNNEVTVVDWSPDNTIKLGGSGLAAPSIGIPAINDLCEYPFGTSGTPPASGPDSRPPMFRCGAQRPAMNAPIAVAPNGHLVAFSYANNARAAGFLIEIDPNALTPIHAADIRNGHLQYGCGVRLDPAFPGCSVITDGGRVNLGNDPQFNGPIHLRTPADIMDNAPSISPDGSLWSIGSYDGGFGFEGVGGYDARGSMIAFNASDGSFHANNPEFGWEVTESARPTSPGGVGFVWLQDRNLYSLFDLGVAAYDRDFHRINTGGPAVDPDAFPIDFVDAHVPFGVRGDHYGINAAGFVYKLNAAGQVVESVPLVDTDGNPVAMETESNYMARDEAGRLYVSFAGNVSVIASSGYPVGSPPVVSAPPRRLLAAHALRLARAAQTPEPGPPSN